MNTSLDEVIDALRASLLENERLRRHNQRLTSAATEPLAVVGIGCRFPDAVNDPDDLWRLVAEGRDVMTGPPADVPFDVSDAHDGLLRHVGVARYTLTAQGTKLFARMGSPVTAPPANSIDKLLSKSQGFLMGYDLATEGKPLEGFPIRPESPQWSFEGTPVCDRANLYVAMRRVEQGRCQLHVACFALTAGGEPIDDGDKDARPAGRMLWRTKICSATTLAGGDWPELSHCLLSLDGGTLLIDDCSDGDAVCYQVLNDEKVTVGNIHNVGCCYDWGAGNCEPCNTDATSQYYGQLCNEVYPGSCSYDGSSWDCYVDAVSCPIV